MFTSIHRLPVVLLLACGIAAALLFGAARAAPRALAQTTLSSGCEGLNNPFFDTEYGGASSALDADWYAGDTITLVASAGPIELYIPHNSRHATAKGDSPLVYVMPEDLTDTGISWRTDAGTLATWEVSCVAGEPPDDHPAHPEHPPHPDHP